MVFQEHGVGLEFGRMNVPHRSYIEGIIFQFALWYGPLFFCLTVTVGMAITILIILGVRACKEKETNHNIFNKKMAISNKNQKALKELSPLMAYPIIFYFMTLLPLSNRIHGAISQRPSFSLDPHSCGYCWTVESFFKHCTFDTHLL